MPLFSRREPPTSLETEQERIRAIRIAAEEELGKLRRELAERVAAVESRERELADAVARVRGSPGYDPLPQTEGAIAHAQGALAAHAQELRRREEALAARERAYLDMEADLARRAKGPQPTSEERLAQIESRLAALQEAEKAFVRTRAELAARTDELDRREAALAELERTTAGGAAAAAMSRAELDELDERLSRLERSTREAAPVETGFGDSLRNLETKGLRGKTPDA